MPISPDIRTRGQRCKTYLTNPLLSRRAQANGCNRDCGSLNGKCSTFGRSGYDFEKSPSEIWKLELVSSSNSCNHCQYFTNIELYMIDHGCDATGPEQKSETIAWKALRSITSYILYNPQKWTRSRRQVVTYLTCTRTPLSHSVHSSNGKEMNVSMRIDVAFCTDIKAFFNIVSNIGDTALLATFKPNLWIVYIRSVCTTLACINAMVT